MYDLALAAMKDRATRLNRELNAHLADAARLRSDAVKSDELAGTAHEELVSMQSAIEALQKIADEGGAGQNLPA